MRKDMENVLNEKDSLTDILTGEKDLVKLYACAYTETVGKDVRRKIKTNILEVAEEQFAIFSLMQKNGYYEPKPANKTVIDENIDKFSKVLKDMNA